MFTAPFYFLPFFTLLRQRLNGDGFVHHAVEIIHRHGSQYAVNAVQKLGIALLYRDSDVDFLVILFSHAFLGLPMNAEAKNEETAAVWNTVMAIIRFLLTPPMEGVAKEEDKESESDD